MKPQARPAGPSFGQAWTRLFSPAFAHRGLWSPHGPPENSLAAFHAACAGGYGVELDVQISSDGEAVVFHDDTLERLTGQPGRTRDHAAAHLASLRLAGTEETIPTLAEALAVIGHRCMVLIELKTPFGEVGVLEKRVSEVLLDHAGPAAVIGFNPYSHAWFADHQPTILRGLNSYGWNDAAAQSLAPDQRRAFANLDHAAIARPDFLCLSADIAVSPKAQTMRRNGLPIVAWTVRDQDAAAALKSTCDNIIFEGFAA